MMKQTKNTGLSPSFWALNWSQFLGALNDNLYRGVMALALIARISATGRVDESPLFLAGLVFAAPFILFSSAAGILADRYSKRRLIVLTNALEAVVMALGLVAFLCDSPPFIYFVLFLMATQSTLFSPSKLGIVPELVPGTRLSHANGLMEMFSYLAIILGTVSAALVYAWCDPQEAAASTTACWKASLISVALALCGLLISLFIRDTGVRASGKKATPLFWKAVFRNLKACRDRPDLLSTLFGIGFFLFLGGYVQLNLVPYGVEVLGLSKAWSFNLFLALALGIGLGSYLAGRASGRGVEIGLVPLGALLFSLMLLLLALPLKNLVFSVAALFLMGAGGGFYIVPLYAFLQAEAPEEDRGELIATSYFLSFVGLAGASALLLLLDGVIGIGPAARFLVLGLSTLLLSAYLVRFLLDHCLRYLGSLGARVIYRLEVRGEENIPLRGGALLVANHVSYTDAILLAASQTRRIRFLMDRTLYEKRGWRWLYRLMGVIPISDRDGPKELARSFKKARAALDRGWLLCLFAEGALTRTGQIMAFRRGVERIVKGSTHPIIPVHLEGLWGSRLSLGRGSILPRQRGRRRVLISAGSALPPGARANEIRQAVMELGVDAFSARLDGLESLPIQFARTARKYWRHQCLEDSTARLRYGDVLTRALVLAESLRDLLRHDRHVGVLFPASVGGALTNLALAFLGKVPVNLNFSASAESMLNAIETCSMTHVITSRAFLEKASLPPLPGMVFLEDLAKKTPFIRVLAALFKARYLPVRRLSPRQALEETATVVFTSGSSGRPKGVELTHKSILANIQGARQVLGFREDDVICGILPFFHSFGLTGTLWLPLITGIAVAYHSRPTDAAGVGSRTEESRATILVTTPTFLLGYMRKVPPSAFRFLRLVITGAERLERRVEAAFERRFGLPPLEGYGATELSPMVSVNVPDKEERGVKQLGTQRGSVGRPLPGIAVRIVDPEDLESEREPGEEGLLLVKGANAMKGYLKEKGLTAEAFFKGWYRTGDLASVDKEGFLRITGRLSRFSKIGGEMVSHSVIEDTLNQGLPGNALAFAVTAVPDEKKGEKIVVLHTLEGGDPVRAHERLREAGLPNLWLPSLRDFFPVETIPVLGSGKVDLQGLTRLALERV